MILNIGHCICFDTSYDISLLRIQSTAANIEIKMKAKVNKSEVFKRGWAIFKNNRDMFRTFSAALRRAWEVEKVNVEYRAEKAAEEAVISELAFDEAFKVDPEEAMRKAYANMVSAHGEEYADKQAQSWV